MKHRNPHPSPYKLERAIEDCHDWLTSHDVIATALAAFYAAQRDLNHPENFPVCKRGQGRAWMVAETVEAFELLLHDLGNQRQVPGFTTWATEILKARRADNADRTTDTEIVDNLSTTVSPGRQHIHRRASQNGKNEG